jgi:nitroreductase
MTVDATSGHDRDLLESCVRTATLAPSLHNSQPWLFRVGAGRVEVFADPARRLDVLDPSGREMMISVGAALFTLRLSLLAAGRPADVAIFPDPGRPDLVAKVSTAGQVDVPDEIERLAAAVPQRHTNRYPFAGTPVPAEAIEQMTYAAWQENARLTVADEAGRDAIVALSRAAEQEQRATSGYREEMARWTVDRVRRYDGIPPSAIGPWDALEVMPIRDFGLLQPNANRTAEVFEPQPSIVVLATVGDDRTAWVTAGQALQRVLLTATSLDLATTPISQPVEVAGIREQLTDTSAGIWAQMVLRVGYGRPATATPRRPLADVLLPETVEV